MKVSNDFSYGIRNTYMHHIIDVINISVVLLIGKTMLCLIFINGFAHILHYNIQDNNKNNQRKLEKQNSLPHNLIKSHMTSVSKSIVQAA